MKRNSALLFSCVLAVVLSVGLGCAKKPDDAKVSSDVQNKFSQDSGLSTKQLNVQAAEGVVTLSGTVDNDAQREAAGKQAASVAGVRTVINNLEVSNEGKPSGTTAQVMPPASTAPRDNPAPADNPKPVKEKNSSKHHHDAAVTQNSDANADQGQPMANNQGSRQGGPDSSAAAAPDNTPAVQTPPPPPPPKKFIIDQGTQFTVRLMDPIDSEKNQTGDTFHATLNAPITSDGEEALPAGVEITGHLVSVKSAGKFAGQSEVVMQLDGVTSGGKTYNLQTDQYKKTGSSRGKNTAEKVGGGAAIGAIIGALAGGGKGAAIGGAAGAGIGGGVQAATKSQQIKLPSETVLNFTLQSPITVVQAPNPNANRQKLNDSQ